MDSHSISSIISTKKKFNDDSKKNKKKTRRGMGKPGRLYIDSTEKIQQKFKTTHDTEDITSIIINSSTERKKYSTLQELLTYYDVPHMDSVSDITGNIKVRTLIQLKKGEGVTMEDNMKNITTTLQNIADTITDINIIFLIHIDSNDIIFIRSDTYDPQKDNVYVYVNNETSSSPLPLRFNIIIHIKDNELTLLHNKSTLMDTSQKKVGEAAATEVATPQSQSEAAVTEVVTPQTQSEAAVTEVATPQAAVAESVEQDTSKKISKKSSVKELSQQKYTYNPEDIHTLLKKVLVRNNSNSDDPMNKEYLIGNPFGYSREYKNLYSQVNDTDKYMLSGRLDTTTNKIVWLRLLE
jgi:hypothetical protein